MEGDAVLSAFIEQLRGLGKLPEDVVKAAAEEVQRVARADAAAGIAPDGTPWPPKKDGGRALVHAAEHLTARAVGTAIVLTLKGVEVLHNFGSKSLPKRQSLPDGGAGVPASMAKAIRATAGRVFSRALGGS